MNHRARGRVFGLVVGLVAAWFAWQWITDPGPRLQRQDEERAVLAARWLLAEFVDSPELEIVDPLAPDRRVGKVYVYAEEPGWAVSGYYRRGTEDEWHPFLLHLGPALELHDLRTDDPALQIR